MARSPAGFHGTTSTFLGAPGTGKTSCLRALLDQRRVDRVLAIDPYDDLPGDVRVSTLKEAERELLRFHRQRRTERIHLVYTPEEITATDAEYLGRWALSIGAVLLVDEAHEVAPNNRHRVPPALLRIARQGRHHGAAVWLASQRPGNLSRDLTANSERWVFRLDEPGDLDYVRRALGKEAVALVRSLEDLHFLYARGRERWRGRLSFHGEKVKIEKIGALPMQLDLLEEP